METASCKCTARDYECDIGYFRDEDGKCQPEGHDPDKPKLCKSTYTGRSGLKKIQKSVCEGGEDLEKTPVERQCNARKEVDSKMTSFENRYNYNTDTFFYFPDSDVSASMSPGRPCVANLPLLPLANDPIIILPF